MFDRHPGEASAVDFDEFANYLLEQGQSASPSQIHGCACGLLATGGPAEPEWGLARLGEALDLVAHGELAGLVMQLYRAAAEALEDEEFDFYPLLPDDEAQIGVRTAALADWSRGFLAGFALPEEARRGGDSEEVLADFEAIAEAEVDDEAPEEESEASYAELVEYLRFAALNLYLDGRGGGAPGPTPDEVLH